IRIRVGRVEEIDAGLEGALDERAARLFIQRPGVQTTSRHAEAHAAQAEPRDLEAGIPESHEFHRRPCYTTLTSGIGMMNLPPRRRYSACCSMISSAKFQVRSSTYSGIVLSSCSGARIGR